MFFKQRSIASRLTTVALLASAGALLTACLAFAYYDRLTFRSNFVRRVSVQAQILAANSASALLFDDPVTAESTLSALRSAPSVIAANIARPTGDLFATYEREGAPPTSKGAVLGPQEDEAYRYLPDRLILTHAIEFNGKRLGYITIEGDLSDLSARQHDYTLISVAILIVSLLAALVMSWITQRVISRPITDLVTVARSITRDRDYARRAVPTGTVSEVLTLVDSFNEMLAQIQARDASLQKAHEGLEERVRRRTAELDNANKELEAFSYSVSHDLRAPLRHVSGFAELLEEHANTTLDDQSRKYIKTIITSARRMAHLIDDLLAFSRIGRAPLSTRPVDLSMIAQEARREVEGQPAPGATASGPPVVWTIGPLPIVAGDAAMLRQVFVNLFSNAVKYSSKKGETRIEVGTTAGAPGETVMFVKDNGVGFDMQYVDKLFGVFQRLHRTSEFEGTGIGLANVKRTIVRHGGRVWASGEVGVGATFYIALPNRGES